MEHENENDFIPPDDDPADEVPINDNPKRIINSRYEWSPIDIEMNIADYFDLEKNRIKSCKYEVQSLISRWIKQMGNNDPNFKDKNITIESIMRYVFDGSIMYQFIKFVNASSSILSRPVDTSEVVQFLKIELILGFYSISPAWSRNKLHVSTCSHFNV